MPLALEYFNSVSIRREQELISRDMIGCNQRLHTKGVNPARYLGIAGLTITVEVGYKAFCIF